MTKLTEFPRPALLWVAAIVPALVGSAWLFDSEFGLNWFLFVGAAAGAFAVARLVSQGRLERPAIILLGWAAILAFGAAVTASEPRQVLIVLSDAMLLGLAVVAIAEPRWGSLSVALLPTVPFLAPFRVWRASLSEIVRLPRSISPIAANPKARGALIALPLAIALLALLHGADPILSWLWSHFAAVLPDWSVSDRAVFFFFLLSITLGATSLAGRQETRELPAIPQLKRFGALGFTEQRMILVTLAAILWLFVILQSVYLVHPPPSLDTGVTFAEYARRGFAELTFAVTLVGVVLLILGRERPVDLTPDNAKALLRWKLLLVVALELVLLSAFRRVLLYEDAYGFTTARLYAQACMIVIGISLAMLWIELRDGRISIALGRRIAVTALAAFTVLVFWNHESWIVNRNFDRARDTGKLDAVYLGLLSADAVPAIVARRAEIPADQRKQVETFSACKAGGTPDRWFEFNLRRSLARTAAESAQLRCETRPASTPKKS